MSLEDVASSPAVTREFGLPWSIDGQKMSLWGSCDGHVNPNASGWLSL